MSKTGFNDFDVSKIQNLESGWKEEWERIANVLLTGDGTSMEDGRLFQACKGVVPLHSEMVEDFVIFILTRMTEKVREQKLFGAFNPEEGTVLDFLCSRNYLEKHFRGYYKSERTNLCWATSFEKDSNPNQDAEEWLDEAPDKHKTSYEQQESEARAENFMDKIFADGSLVIRCPSQGSRLFQQAGLQLYLRVSQQNTDMVAMRDSIRSDVANALKLSDVQSDETLKNSHRTAREKWRGKIEICCIKLKKGAFKIGSNTQERCEKNMSEYTVRHYFCPIETHEIVRLLLLPENSASQYLKRYREKLKSLLEDYQSQYEKIF